MVSRRITIKQQCSSLIDLHTSLSCDLGRGMRILVNAWNSFSAGNLEG